MTETIRVKCLIQDETLFLTKDHIYEGTLDPEDSDVAIINDVGEDSYLFVGEYEIAED